MRVTPMNTDFSGVTEMSGTRATREQLSMIQTRYAEAARIAENRRVLEVACGAGRGLGLIARRARTTVGGDYTFLLVQRAKRYYGTRVPVLQLDAQALPFRHGSFDVVVLFEAIYYLPDAERFVSECRRVLSPGGHVLLCSANREWAEFTSSAYAKRFYSAAELVELLARHGFEAHAMAAFPTAPHGLRSALVSMVRRAAVACHLVPATLVGRERLKRVFYGPLTSLGSEVGEDNAEIAALVPVDVSRPVRDHKVIYAVGRLG